MLPPSFEYSYEPCPPVAVTVIVPSVSPQSVGFVEDTFTMLGAVGAPNITGLSASKTKQVPSVFLTATLYEPDARPENEALFCQFKPPSMEYSRVLPADEVAVIVIVPSSTLQSVGSVDETFEMVGTTLFVNVTGVPVTIQVPSAFLTRMS